MKFFNAQPDSEEVERCVARSLRRRDRGDEAMHRSLRT
jgi:hypothetical protein